MSDIIPLFSSHFSIGKSILTLENEEMMNNKPISIISIAKKYNLKDIFLVETQMTGFIEAYNNTIKHDMTLHFGLKLVVCQNMEDKSENSFNSECKVIIWAANSDGYYKLIKIFTEAATNGFYYTPRLDWKRLVALWDNNLLLSIPFYSSFLHNNLLRNHQCMPDFGGIKPNLMISDNNLPFDKFIRQSILEYNKNNNLELIDVHNIYYYKREHWDAYCCFRAIHNRSIFANPKIDHFSSTEFSFESFCEKSNIEFKI